MSERVQKTKTAPQKEAVVEKVDPKVSVETEKLKSELDELLDEIDGVLEENAEEFIKSYVQKGGEICETLLSVWYNVKEWFKRTVLHLPTGGFNEGMRGAWLR